MVYNGVYIGVNMILKVYTGLRDPEREYEYEYTPIY